MPFAQAPSDDITLLVETFGDLAVLGPTIRRELKKFDPGAMIYSSTTLQHHMEQALFLDRVAVGLSTGLGVVGFLLTAAGLFGVGQYAVNRRTREIGVRVALGARPGEIQRMVLLESLRMAAWGIPIGLLALAATARAAQSQLPGVSALDPMTYAAGASAAVVIAVATAGLPAMRAARIDAMCALRSE